MSNTDSGHSWIQRGESSSLQRSQDGFQSEFWTDTLSWNLFSGENKFLWTLILEYVRENLPMWWKEQAISHIEQPVHNSGFLIATANLVFFTNSFPNPNAFIQGKFQIWVSRKKAISWKFMLMSIPRRSISWFVWEFTFFALHTLMVFYRGKWACSFWLR